MGLEANRREEEQAEQEQYMQEQTASVRFLSDIEPDTLVHKIHVPKPPPARTPEELYLPPAAMVEKLMERSEKCNWPFKPDHLHRLNRHVPKMPRNRLLAMLSFEIWFGDLETTFVEMVRWLWDEWPDFWVWGGMGFDSGHLAQRQPDDPELRPFNRYGVKPGFGWSRIWYQNNWKTGSRPIDVTDYRTAAGLDLMSAFAIHKGLPPRIDHKYLPACWLPGIVANVPTVLAMNNTVPVLDKNLNPSAWETAMPVLDWVNGRLGLSAFSTDFAFTDLYAAPVRF